MIINNGKKNGIWNTGNIDGVFLTRFELNGNMTLETAMVLPIFIFSIICFIYFMAILNFQNIMQSSVNQTAKEIGKYAYVINRLDKKLEDNQNDSSGLDIDNNLLISGLNTGYISKAVLTEEVKKYADKVNVYGGVDGISLFDSRINEDDEGINDIRVSYKIFIGFPGQKGYGFRFANRCYFRSWIGTSIEKQSNNEKEGQIVFITKTGDVYHLTDTCTYIKFSITKVLYSELSYLRNESGAIYRACNKCVSSQPQSDDIIYITASGTKYHCDSKCSKIKRDIFAIDISEVGNRKLCSRCGKIK